MGLNPARAQMSCGALDQTYEDSLHTVFFAN
jgi:hypothetical protein